MLIKPENAAIEVTVWSRKNSEGEWEHNHIEDGHCPVGTTHPKPKTQNQVSAWAKGSWVYEHAWFDGHVPPKVLHDPIEVKRKKEAQV